MNTEGEQWDEDLERDIFEPPDCDHILDIQLSNNSREDHWSWKLDPRGVYSMKSGYKVSTPQIDVTSIWSRGKMLFGVVEDECTPKIKCLIWRACRNLLPSRFKLFLLCEFTPSKTTTIIDTTTK